MIWKCKDGRELAMSDMKDGHLLNAHRMMIRKARLVMYIELLWLGNMPPDAPDEAASEIMRDLEPFWERISGLTDELQRRHLTPLETL